MAKPRHVPGQASEEEYKGSTSKVASAARPSNSEPPGHDPNPSSQPQSWWDTTILDIGATCDIIGKQAMEWATIGDRKYPVDLETVSDTIPVTQEGDWTISGALKMAKSLVVPSSLYSLVSLPNRLLQGWKWRAEGEKAELVSPGGEQHMFDLVKGLFRYRGKAKQRGGKFVKKKQR